MSIAWPGLRPAGWDRTVRTICKLGAEPVLVVVTSIGEAPVHKEILIYSQTSMAGASLGQWKFVQDMGGLSLLGLTMAPGQEKGNLFRFSP